MPRITVTLDDASHEWVRDQADERDCSLSDVMRELVNDARGEGGSIISRLSDLEARVERLEDADAAPTLPDATPDVRLNHADAVESDGEAMQSDAGLDQRVRDQLPKGTTEAEADGVVAIVEYIRDEGWATPKEIKQNIHPEHPAGSSNTEHWWREKMWPVVEGVDGVKREGQRRVEWAGDE